MSSVSEPVESDNIKQSSLWWLKSTAKKSQNLHINVTNDAIITSPNNLDINISSSIDEFLEKDQIYNKAGTDDGSEADIGSIIEEINKLASQSPIGVFESAATDKSVDEILQEAEKLYMESSKSFEQLSSKSRSSIDYSLSKSSSISFRSKKSTPSPKSSHSAIKLIHEGDKLDVITDLDIDQHTPRNQTIPLESNISEEILEKIDHLEELENISIGEIEHIPDNELEHEIVNDIEHEPINEIETVPNDEVDNTLVDEVGNIQIDELENVSVDEVENIVNEEIENIPIDEIENEEIGTGEEVDNVPAELDADVVKDEATDNKRLEHQESMDESEDEYDDLHQEIEHLKVSLKYITYQCYIYEATRTRIKSRIKKKIIESV